MPVSFRRIVFFAVITLAVSFISERRACGAEYEGEAGLCRDVSFLADSICAGRASGSRGAVEACCYISRRLRDNGYDPVFQTYKAVPTGGGSEAVVCRNILAESRHKGATKWIVVTAYYDGLGTRDGKFFPGADSNASGVAGLLAIADSLAADRTISQKYNFLLVALDGHNCDNRGAVELMKRSLNPSNVRMVINLDIIGSSLAPVQPYHPRYLMALGAEPYRKTLDAIAAEQGLTIYYEYYRSREFTDLFFRRMGDQKLFLTGNLPTVLFTSGITMNTNRETDTPETLDYGQFAKRIALIMSWLRKI